MIRDSLATGSKHFFLCLTGANGLRVQYRPTESGMSYDTIVPPLHDKTLNLKIIKTGNVLQAYCKRIGDTEWSKFGSAQTIEFSASYFFGIAVSSLDYSKKATLKAQDLAVNSNLSIQPSRKYYGPNPAFSNSFEDFAQGLVINDERDEDQCRNARELLGFDRDYPYDTEVRDRFNDKACGIDHTTLDHMSEALAEPPVFTEVKFEAQE
jgi:hypothetical protein